MDQTSHSPLAEKTQNLVVRELPSDQRSRFIAGEISGHLFQGGFSQKTVRSDVHFQQRFYFPAKFFIARTGLIKESPTLAGHPFQSQLQDLVDLLPAFRSHKHQR